MICFFSLGSNLGDKESNLAKAIEHICRHEQIRFLAKSSIYETEPQNNRYRYSFSGKYENFDKFGRSSASEGFGPGFCFGSSA